MRDKVTTIFGGAHSLRFESAEELAQYDANVHEAAMQHYHQARARYGIWASNQHKYVQSAAQLNQHDQRGMENQYATWLARQSRPQLGDQQLPVGVEDAVAKRAENHNP